MSVGYFFLPGLLSFGRTTQTTPLGDNRTESHDVKHFIDNLCWTWIGQFDLFSQCLIHALFNYTLEEIKPARDNFC